MPTPAPAAIYGKPITPREEQVLSLLSKGYIYKEIADEMEIGEQTVKNHMMNLRARLGARTTAHAVAMFMETE